MSSFRPYREADSLYIYSNEPRVIPSGKYRCQRDEEDHLVNYGNIMYDKRVVRGSTYSRKVLTQRGCPDYSKAGKKEGKRRSDGREVESLTASVVGEKRIRTPDPVSGRKHFVVQTEVFLKGLEFLKDTSTAQCQTEPFVKNPPKPFLKAAKNGIDEETQIIPEELFDFDSEVNAPVTVLVSKVVEQSLREAKEEEELAVLLESQNIILEKRNADKAEGERLEEKVRKKNEEKERVMKEKEEKLKQERETLEKISSYLFASTYLSNLVPEVFRCLTQNNFFYDCVERDVELQFMPWLMSGTRMKLQHEVTSRTVLDSLICQVVQKRLQETHYPSTLQESTEHAQYLENTDSGDNDTKEVIESENAVDMQFPFSET